MTNSIKIKGVVAAMGLALAGGANAAVLQFSPNTGNSSFFFTSFDGVAGRSYGIELRASDDALQLDELRALANGGAAFSLSFQLPNLAAFYGNFNNVEWGLVAADSTQSSPTGSAGTRILQTTADANNVSALGSAVFGAAESLQNLIQFNISSACNTPGAACTATSTSDTQYLGGSNWGSSYGIGALTYGQPVSDVNSSIQELVFIEPDVAVEPGNEFLIDFIPTINTQLMVNGAPVLAKLDFGNNLLTISASPIPVPAAVWLMGSALVGLGAASRRKQGA